MTRRWWVVAAALLAAGCGRAPKRIDARTPIIVVSIDTLRSDHLPAYGYGKIETPAIDALRADSILYQHAYSQCPLTLVSHSSAFTGVLPSEHGIRDNTGYELAKNVRTLPELLKTKGYATGGAVSAIVLRGETGFKRGFDFYDDDVDIDPNFFSMGRAQRSGDETRQIAEKWITGHKQLPFFFFLHIYEPHSPYDPPEPFKSKYGETYDGDVAAADAVVGRFLSYLREEGIYDKALIVLMSDHGEGLGDHGEDEHGILLYRETLQVPLMLKLPGGKLRGKSVATPVQLVDLFATITGALGIDAKSKGESLLAAANGEVKNDRPIYSETYYPRFHFGWSDLHSIVSASNHYIQAPKPELYDLAADPTEKTNRLQENRRAYNALRAAIVPFIKSAEAPKAIDNEQAQQLAALGYIGSTVSTSANEVLPDPKDKIGTAHQIREAFSAYQQKRYEEAVTICSALLRENPRMLDIVGIESRSLAKLGRYEEGIGAAKNGLMLSPTSTALILTVANLSLQVNRPDDAAQHARLLLHDIPNEAHRVLSEAALMKRDYTTATTEANLALGERRDKPYALVLLGRIAQEQGRFDDALKQYDAAKSILDSRKKPPIEKLNFFRGDALARLGRGDEAEQAFRAEIAAFPGDPQPYKNLVLLYTMEGRNEAATKTIFELEKASPTPPAYAAIAEVLRVIGDSNGARFWAARGLARYPGDVQLRKLLRG
jgi:arylsulfatase A-like enzyme/Flp pilus assembly protein TadD